MTIYAGEIGSTVVGAYNAVSSAELVEKLSGECTLDVTIPLLDGEQIAVGMTVMLDHLAFDIVRVAQTAGSIPMTTISCEHQSYRLNNEEYNLVTFVYTGTVAGGLAQLLSGTDFAVGSVEAGTEEITVSITDESPLNRRSALIRYAEACGLEIEYEYYNINLVAHRGNATRKELLDGTNVTGLSAVLDSRAGTHSYDVAFHKKSSYGVGDEVHITYTPLVVDVDTRIVGMAYNPFYTYGARVEVGDYVPDILAAQVTKDEKLKQVFLAANGELVSRIEGAEGGVAEALQTVSGFDTRITNAEGKATSASQKVDSITLSAVQPNVDTRVGSYYSIANATDNLYTFTMQDGYFTSGNKGVASSWAIGEIAFNFEEDTAVVFKCIHEGESTFDYGVIGAIDTSLPRSISFGDELLHSFRGKNSTEVQEVEAVIPAGSHFVEVGYRKDVSVDNGADCLKVLCVTREYAKSTTLTLSAGGAVLSSTEIKFQGLVTFESLSTPGAAVIDGGNVKADTLTVNKVFYDNGTREIPVFLSEAHTSHIDSVEVTVGVSENTAYGGNAGYIRRQFLHLYGTDIDLRYADGTGGYTSVLALDCIIPELYPISNNEMPLGKASNKFSRLYVGYGCLYVDSNGNVKSYTV